MTLLAALSVRAEDKAVQEFSGSGPTTTAHFKTNGKWEVRWNARQVVSVAVVTSDGTIVAGAAGVLRGSLFLPVGGEYYLKVSDGTAPPPPTPASAPSTNSPASSPPTTNAPVATPPATNAPPTQPPAADSAPPADQQASWHLQVVEISTTPDPSFALTVFTPFFVMPDAVTTPITAVPPPPPPTLTDHQLHALVTVKGDAAQGTGFLLHTPEGNCVVTSLHLLAGNPNVKIFSSSGAPIDTTAIKGAPDRDLAYLTVTDHSQPFLPMATSNEPHTGDQVIIPDLSQPGTNMAKYGNIGSVDPLRLDFDIKLNGASEGAPVLRVKDGQALAVVVPNKRPDISQQIASAWQGNPIPGVAGIFPFYGLRLGETKGWETYDAARFLNETAFLHQFHITTRYIDSYLNGPHRHAIDEANDADHPRTGFYQQSDKLRDAIAGYKRLSAGADQAQRMEAARELLSDIATLNNSDVDALEGWNNLYAYDRTWAREELSYRKALKSEIDDLANNIARFDLMVRTR